MERSDHCEEPVPGLNSTKVAHTILNSGVYDKDGKLKWYDEAENTVVNAGLQHILDVTFTGATQVSTWYVGLTDSSPSVDASDTLGTHSGWTEVTAYSGDRKEYVETFIL